MPGTWDEKEGIGKDGGHLEEEGAPDREGCKVLETH